MIVIPKNPMNNIVALFTYMSAKPTTGPIDESTSYRMAVDVNWTNAAEVVLAAIDVLRWIERFSVKCRLPYLFSDSKQGLR